MTDRSRHVVVIGGQRPGAETVRRIQKGLYDAGFEVELVFDDPGQASENLKKAMEEVLRQVRTVEEPKYQREKLSRGEKHLRKKHRGW